MQCYPPYPWRSSRHTLGSPRQPITVTAADIQISQKIIEYTNVLLRLRGVGGFNKKPLMQYYPPYPWRSSRHTLGSPRQPITLTAADIQMSHKIMKYTHELIRLRGVG